MSYPVPDPFFILPDSQDLSVAVDTEASGRHPDDGARVATVSVAWRGPETGELNAYAFPFDQGLREGKPEWNGQGMLFGAEDINLGLDAWVFLMRWLKRQRLTMHPVLYDTPMIRAGTRMASENRWWSGPDLIDRIEWDTQVGCKEISPTHPQALKANAVRLKLLKGTAWAERMGGWQEGIEARDQTQLKAHLRKIKVRGGGTAFSAGRWDLGDWEAIGPYAALDALETLLLREYQLRILEEGRDGSHGPAAKHAAKWMPRELRKTRVLYAMMSRGIAFDRAKCLAGAVEITKARDEVAKTLPFKPTIEAARVWYFGNGDGGRFIPYDWTGNPDSEKRKPKLDQEIVHRMVEEKVPHAADYQLWTKLNNSLSKWYLAYPAMTGSDGRLRCVFKQTQVRSGRTSVERINLQALPHDYQVQARLPAGVPTPRGCVSTKPKHQLWTLDLEQAELRVAARWAPCPPMLDLIRTGADTHGVTATELFGVRKDHPDWVMYRQVAKRANFSLIFDIGALEFQRTLSKFLGLQWPLDQVQQTIGRWRSLYPEFRRAVYRAMHVAQHRKYVKLVNGRLSWFDDIDLYSDPECHKAFNRFVQASLAELGAEWMIWIEQEHPGILVNWVHDAAYIEVPNEEVWRVDRIAQQGAKMFEEMFDVAGGVDSHLEAAA